MYELYPLEEKSVKAKKSENLQKEIDQLLVCQRPLTSVFDTPA